MDDPRENHLTTRKQNLSHLSSELGSSPQLRDDERFRALKNSVLNHSATGPPKVSCTRGHRPSVYISSKDPKNVNTIKQAYVITIDPSKSVSKISGNLKRFENHETRAGVYETLCP